MRRFVGASLMNLDGYRLYDTVDRRWLRPNPLLAFDPYLPFSQRWVECDPPEEFKGLNGSEIPQKASHS